MKALIIDEPWIGKILRGEKNWEMRKTACHLRGQFALIRKGSGAVVGIAEMIDSLPPIGSRKAYAEAERHHGIPPDRQERAFTDGWATPWVLANARALKKPVAYPHPSGAVVWVNLDPAIEAAVRAELGGSGSTSMPGNPTPEPAAAQMPKVAAAARPPAAPPPPPTPSGDAGVRTVVVTGGNIRNNHIYLPLDFFPADAIGGGRRAEVASRTISVTFQPGLTCETDIDGEKRILRARGPVGDFLARAGLNEGDTVLITRHSDHAYTIAKAPDGRQTTA